MVRPRKCRQVRCEPGATYFKPRGVPLRACGEVALAVEELEALRLKDLESLDQETAALRMGVSRPTFHRVLREAHAKVAEALVEGRALRIGGGDYAVGTTPPAHTPPGRHHRCAGSPRAGKSTPTRVSDRWTEEI